MDSIIFLWTLGAVFSIIGALCYAELATAIKENGGEFKYLSKLYNPFLGFFSGIVSLFIGFAAPIALAAMALASYFQSITTVPKILTASIIILLIAFLQSINFKSSVRLQHISTIFKLLFICLVIAIGFSKSTPINSISNTTNFSTEVFSSAFAISLVYISYSYSGWNASAYIVNDLENPQKLLPKALLLGSTVVGLVYVLIQIVILRNATPLQITGKIEVAQIAAGNILNVSGLKIFTILLGLILVSSISSMLFIGSRVSNILSKDFKIFSFLQKSNSTQLPIYGIWFQAIIALVFVLTNSFENVLLFCGLALQICVTLSVFGIFLIRTRTNNSANFKSPFFPFIQILFMVYNIWIIIFTLYSNYKSAIALVLLLAVSFLLYKLNNKLNTIEYAKN
jgi:basic amino acid/polyamine antiporter, APA family